MNEVCGNDWVRTEGSTAIPVISNVADDRIVVGRFEGHVGVTHVREFVRDLRCE